VISVYSFRHSFFVFFVFSVVNAIKSFYPTIDGYIFELRSLPSPGISGV